MLKHSLSALTALILSGAALAEQPAANDTAMAGDLLLATPHLIRHSEISSDQVTLGDLFSGIGAKAGQPIGSAPAPGDRIVVSARQLNHIAQRFGIDWQPQSQHDHAVLERASQRIDAETLRVPVIEAVQRAMGADTDISLSQVRALTLPTSAPADITVTALDIDPRSNGFIAMVSVRAGEHSADVSVSGSAVKLIDMPVMLHRVRRGETVTSADVEWRAIPADRIERDALDRLDGIIGQAATRTLMPGSTVAETDLRPPFAIRKGDLVTMIVEAGGLAVTAQGRALDDGAMNDVVRVMNVGSKRVVDARVAGSQTVRVAAPSSLIN